MSKIPEWAREEARRLNSLLGFRLHPREQVYIARALLAERERAATIADGVAAQIDTFHSTMGAGARSAAAAIRGGE